MKTLAQEAFELLNSVPSEKFIKGDFTNGVDCCCAVGHYKRLKSSDPNNYSLDNCDDGIHSDIRWKSQEFAEKTYRDGFDIADVNNSPRCNGYTEPEIKDRVLHLLKDMIEAGY